MFPRNKYRIHVLLSLLIVAGWVSMAESSPSIFIRNVTIIDGQTEAPREGMSIVVNGDRIVSIEPGESLSVPDGSIVVDGTGDYLIPGLWDMHTHALWEPFVGDGFLALFVLNGITGIRDMGGTVGALNTARKSKRSRDAFVPRVFACGPWLNLLEIDPRTGIAVQSAQEAREAVRTLSEAGVDFIKVYTQLSRDAFLAVIEQSAALGLPVAGHVPAEVSAAEASDLGMRSIEHMQVELGGYCHGEGECARLFETFRRNQTWQTPTLVIRRNRAFLDDPNLVEDASLRFAPPYLRAEWEAVRSDRAEQDYAAAREQFDGEKQLARALLKAEVPMLVGSDAGDLYSLAGFSLHDELLLLVEAGMTEWEVLRAATFGAAEYLGSADSLGTVEIGKLADLVLLRENPLDDIRNTRSIRAVIVGGELLTRETVDDRFRQIRARISAMEE